MIYVTGGSTTVEVITDNVEVVTAGIQGPAGPVRELNFTSIAGEVLGGYRAISVIDGLAYYTDLSSEISVLTYAGMSLNAAVLGGVVSIQQLGLVVESTWAWANGSIYVGSSGYLTQVVPVTGVFITVGAAVSPDSIILHSPIVIF